MTDPPIAQTPEVARAQRDPRALDYIAGFKHGYRTEGLHSEEVLQTAAEEHAAVYLKINPTPRKVHENCRTCRCKDFSTPPEGDDDDSR